MPSRSTAVLIVGLALIAGLLGWNYVARPFSQVEESSPVQASPSPLSSLEQRMRALSTEEKIHLMMVAPVTVSNSASASADLAWINEHQPGAVILFGTQISSSSAKKAVTAIEAAYTAAQYSPLIAVDHEGGTVQRLSGTGYTKVPSWQSLCAQPASASAQVLKASAAELAQTGIDMVLAPAIDVASSNAVLKSRVCSAQPEVVAEQASSFIEIFSAERILPVAKHFPGIGKTTRDLHTTFDRVTIKPEDAVLYKVILDQFPRIGVMISHAGVTNQYPDLPCSLSLDCIKELVNNYPQVIVVSDALEMKSASYLPDTSERRPLPEVAVRAVSAGNSLLVFGPTVTDQDLTQVTEALKIAYERDELVKSQVDRSAKLLLQLRDQL